MIDLLQHPEMVRNVAVVGHLHHGKTSLLDMLVFETHKLVWEAEKPVSRFAFPQFVLLNRLLHVVEVYRYSSISYSTTNIPQVITFIAGSFNF